MSLIFSLLFNLYLHGYEYEYSMKVSHNCYLKLNYVNCIFAYFDINITRII